MNKLTTPEQAAKLKRLGMPQERSDTYYQLSTDKFLSISDFKWGFKPVTDDYIAIHTLHDVNDWLYSNYGYWVSTTVGFVSGQWKYGFSGKANRQSLFMFPDQYIALSTGITSILNIIK